MRAKREMKPRGLLFQPCPQRVPIRFAGFGGHTGEKQTAPVPAVQRRTMFCIRMAARAIMDVQHIIFQAVIVHVRVVDTQRGPGPQTNHFPKFEQAVAPGCRFFQRQAQCRPSFGQKASIKAGHVPCRRQCGVSIRRFVRRKLQKQKNGLIHWFHSSPVMPYSMGVFI